MLNKIIKIKKYGFKKRKIFKLIVFYRKRYPEMNSKYLNPLFFYYYFLLK